MDFEVEELTAKLPKASFFKKLIESIKDVVIDANFEFTEERIALQAMDSTHIALVSVEMRPDLFSEYTCPKKIVLGTKMESLHKILRCSTPEDDMTLRAQESGEVIRFVFESKNRVSEWELKLVNLETDPLVIPEQDYSVTLKMPSAELLRIYRVLTVLGETVLISAKKEGVFFSTSGDIGSGKEHIKPSEEDVTITLEEPVEASFSLKQLGMFAKAHPLSKYVVLGLSDQQPISISFDFDDDTGSVRFYLAPKIDD
eukprot:TRINITY_DN9015_c0_g1_i1.p1 TRINITY_DN9015_c0_g1~~TRINITY_DN9015_c0_g1_i1.p1  ORF type:complete len:264 (-),score=50.28 TRINITY_DN9015_c0_g1_i1:98-868(-)